MMIDSQATTTTKRRATIWIIDVGTIDTATILDTTIVDTATILETIDIGAIATGDATIAIEHVGHAGDNNKKPLKSFAIMRIIFLNIVQ